MEVGLFDFSTASDCTRGKPVISWTGKYNVSSLIKDLCDVTYFGNAIIFILALIFKFEILIRC